MFPLPSPLHPAIVHFPIVLILIGTAAAVAAVFLRRWHLPWFAAGLLAAGAAGAFAATWTGGAAAELVGELSPVAEKLLDEHEDWGELTRDFALVAAVLTIIAASIARFPRAARTVAVVGALMALVASACVMVTGHYGGQMVYKHGVGINITAGQAESALPTGSLPSKEADQE
jgi:uncharacterized membrane protein